MAVAESVHLRTSLRAVLKDAGVGLEGDQSHYLLDLSILDNARWPEKREHALQTTASLLFGVDDNVSIVARLPEKLRSRRALAATGVLFALVQHHAVFEDASTRGPSESEGLFSENAFRRLASVDSWGDTYTPFDVELRDLMLAGVADLALRGPERGFGIYDTDFAAFVNPHRLPAGRELSGIAELASPWIARLLAGERSDSEQVVEASMELLGHALDNVREHAFDEQIRARSLVTLGRVRENDRDMYRLQILDNGIGIPASLQRQIGADMDLSVDEAKQLVDRAVHGTSDGFDPLLPLGRNLGLPRMRKLAGDLDGHLSIVTCGPDLSKITLYCQGIEPSESFADLIPVTGTVVTLTVPLAEREQAEEHLEGDLETLDL